MNDDKNIQAPRVNENLEAPRGNQDLQAPRANQDVQAPRVNQDIEAPRAAVDEAPHETTGVTSVEVGDAAVPDAAPVGDQLVPVHQYRVGDRVGLLGRVKDVHDSGNIGIEIEGTGGEPFVAPQYVHISKAALEDGVDLILKARRGR
jgi:hypothetical protein